MDIAEKIVLFKPNGKAVKTFDTLPEAQKFCIENRICNGGWVARSLETGEKFYNTKISGRTRSHNDYYRGFNKKGRNLIDISTPTFYSTYDE